MARRLYSVEVILENDSSDSNGEDSVDLENGIISDPADSGSEDELVNNLVFTNKVVIILQWKPMTIYIECLPPGGFIDIVQHKR